MKNRCPNDSLDVWQRGVDTEAFHPRHRSQEMRERLSGGCPDATVLIYVGRLGFGETSATHVLMKACVQAFLCEKHPAQPCMRAQSCHAQLLVEQPRQHHHCTATLQSQPLLLSVSVVSGMRCQAIQQTASRSWSQTKVSYVPDSMNDQLSTKP